MHSLMNHSTATRTFSRGTALVAFDGSTLNVPDEATNREAFGAPGASRGRAALPQVRLTALVELGTRAAFAWRAGAYDESEEAHVEAHSGGGGPPSGVDRCGRRRPRTHRAMDAPAGHRRGCTRARSSGRSGNRDANCGTR